MINNEFWSIAISMLLSGTCICFDLWVLFSTTMRRRQSLHKTLDESRTTDTDSSDETSDVETEPSGSVLEWTGVTCTYVTKRGRDKRVVLSNAVGRLKTRELTAIMGPSGSGKSTLLDILSGRKTTGLMTGRLQIFENKSVPADKASTVLRKVTAFVPQEVIFFPMQTPEEAVLFVAHLTHGKNGTNLAECHRILRDVGLSDPNLYKRPIGGSLAGGMNVRGLSGGEKKRLALACALAMKPKLLMLDEITSGLDSENALMIVRLVKQVCITRNVAAAVVIHQPDGYIFETFDRLVLLSHGKCIFSDDTSRLDKLYKEEFFSELPTSPHEIPLDLMRKLSINGEATCSDLILCDVYSEIFADDVPDLNDLYEGEPCQRDADASSFRDEEVYSEVFTDDVAQLKDLQDFPSIDFTESTDPTTSSSDDESGTSATRKLTTPSPPEPISFSWKLFVVLQRNLTNHYVRNVTNLAARLLCYSACSLLDGAIFWQVGTNKTVNTEEAVVGAFTFITMISYLLPFATIPIFVHEKKFFLSERSLGLYSPWIYCISQAVLETWVLVQTAIVEALIVIPMCGLQNSSQPYWESFFTLLSALIASGLTGSALVLFFSILMPTHDLAFLLCAGVVTISLGMSGGFVPLPSLQDFIDWLQWMSPCKYSLQALTIGHFKGTDSEPFVEMMGLDRPNTVTANIGALFVFFALWAIGSMFALHRQREHR